MIVVDTSAFLAVAFNESTRPACEAALAVDRRRLMSAATLAEALITSEAKGIGAAVRSLIDAFHPEIVSVDDEAARLAFQGFLRYGKGRHPARLNYGDCFPYALARQLDCPLLFIGNDFSQTDIRSALQARPFHGGTRPWILFSPSAIPLQRNSNPCPRRETLKLLIFNSLFRPVDVSIYPAYPVKAANG